MTIKAYIFDLDGTLLNTLPDLVELTNSVLESRGWPLHTQGEILSYVGDGGRVLLRRAAPANTPQSEIDEAFEYWRELYPTKGHAMTVPYDGIGEALTRLKAQGVKLGVLSNKFDAAVKAVIEEKLPGLFDVAYGECAEIPRKPDPRGLRFLLTQLDVSPDDTVYVGDSGTDMAVAIAVGTLPVGVAWGYRSVDELVKAGAARVIHHPSELLSLLPCPDSGPSA